MSSSPKNAVYHRKGFGLKDLVDDDLKEAYESNLIAELKSSGNTLSRNGITIRLAEAFGFCWGVDRAVSMAYETRKHFPDRKIWITNEIIHNPFVNEDLKRMGIDFLPERKPSFEKTEEISIPVRYRQEDSERPSKDFDCVGEGDVVILPAFGASEEEMDLLLSRRCEVVDTTCPWVSRVWNRVVKYAKDDYTAIIHGKYNHEETVATASRSATYLIVQNLEDAQIVAEYILEGGSKEEFLQRFQKSCSLGFDPDIHLERVGVANQTTMLKGETEKIGKLFEKTMLSKYGPGKIDEHFLSPGDTICDATQERQDAMLSLVEENLDLLLIIGGFNSSNTGHLHEIALERGLVAYHIDGAQCLVSASLLQHKSSSDETMETASNWLPDGPVKVGISAGASTPNLVVAEVIQKLFALRDN